VTESRMVVQSDPNLTLYCPLWGVAFDASGSEMGVGLVGGKVLAYIPFDEEWRALQQSDVFEQRDAAAGRAAAPLCLVAVEPLLSNETIDQATGRVGDALLQSTRDAVLALRLFKPGWFLHPELAETAFVVAAEGWDIRRTPGPYRQAFMTSDPYRPYAGYALSLGELTTHLNERRRVTRIFDLLTSYRAPGGNSSVEIALENFDRSFAYQMTGAQRAANLFMALDTMLGGMSARRIGRVPLRQRYFRRRVQAALSAANDQGIDVVDEAKWLDAKEGGRGLRNAIAHGDLGAVAFEIDPVIPRLQHIVRLILLQYLIFAIRWACASEAIAARLALPQLSLAAAYNKVLELQVSDDCAALDLLQEGR
jgi:hypothetical protein